MQVFQRIAALITIPALILLPAVASAQDASEQEDGWEFSAAVYGWFPDLKGTSVFMGEENDFEVEVGDILDNLDFTFQGNFDARKGKWGVYTDLVYLDLSNSTTFTQENSIGDVEIPADGSLGLGLGVESLIWTALGYYRIGDAEQATLDVMGGFRYADIEQTLDWTREGTIGNFPLPGDQGSQTVSQDYLDFVVGFRGRVNFGSDLRWFLPYYGDIGTGDSDFTWQGAIGLGYAFSWGDVAAVYRHLDYELPSDAAIRELQMSGPALGVSFRW